MSWSLGAFLIGVVFEAGGLVTAVVGLVQTWRDNADGRPFLPPVIARLFLRRRDATVHPMAARAEAHSGTSADLTVITAGVMSPEQRLDALEAAQREHSNRLSAAEALATWLSTELQQVRTDSEAAAERAEIAAQAYARGLSVGGVRLAAVGLGFVTFGFILQAIPSVATWSG